MYTSLILLHDNLIEVYIILYKPICRLLTTGTIEEKIYQRQISKANLSETVVDLNYLGSLKLSTAELKVFFIKISIITKKYYKNHYLKYFSFLGFIYVGK